MHQIFSHLQILIAACVFMFCLHTHLCIVLKYAAIYKYMYHFLIKYMRMHMYTHTRNNHRAGERERAGGRGSGREGEREIKERAYLHIYEF